MKPTYTDNRPRKFTESVANAQKGLSGKQLASRVDRAEQAAVNPNPKPKRAAKKSATKPIKQSATMKNAAAKAAAERRAATARDNAEIARRRAAKGKK